MDKDQPILGASINFNQLLKPVVKRMIQKNMQKIFQKNNKKFKKG